VRIIFFLALLVFSTVAWSQIETETAVSTTASVKTSDEAKPYLLHTAVLATIKKYSTELGFDSVAFEKKLQEKFNQWFETYKQRSLTDKFGKNYTTELSPEQKKTFLEGMEGKKNLEFIRYAKLDQLLDNYGFKQILNDPAVPTNWKGTVILNLNKVKLDKFYARISSTETKPYSKIFIYSDVNLLGLTWAELGLEKDSTFTDPLVNSWDKWFQTNQPANVEEIVVCSGACREQFKSWQELPQEQGMQVPEDLLNSLWVKISFNLRKLSYLKEINEWKFEWDGSVILLDSNTKKIISSYTMYTETKTWRGLEQKALNSALASSMYRSPMDPFTKITKKIQDSPRLSRLSRLVITGHRRLGDVVSLIDQLKKSGQKLHFDVQLDLFTQKEAELLCFYQGEEKSFTDLLSDLKELKSSHSYRIVNEFTGVHHVLKLIAE
jgi:hypothetical protein